MLSNSVSKMPGPTFNLPAGPVQCGGTCPAANRAAVCKHCYARKGRFNLPSAAESLRRNLEASRAADFADRFAEEVRRKVEWRKRRGLGPLWLRMHSSGDIYSAEYARKLRDAFSRFTADELRVWVPTLVPRFGRIVAEAGPHVCVRHSSPDVGKPVELRPASVVIDGTEEDARALGAYPCPATFRKEETGGKCGECRACWNPDVELVAYRKH